MTKTTNLTLKAMKAAGDKIAMLTAYDASFARLMDQAGVDIVLVGDSLGMVVQGNDSTVSVSMDHMAYHVSCVAAGVSEALVLGDLPFGSFHEEQRAMDNAVRLLAAGAEMVKLEGAGPMIDVIAYLSDRGVSVAGHLGLTPQTAHRLGGFRVQARDEAAAARLIADARAVEDAGAQLLVLECIPSPLASEVSEQVGIPTIGIGAGPGCDGQVLVLHDMLGLVARPPKFVANFMATNGDVLAAFSDYVAKVKSGEFPGPEHQYA
jgi:3-methyl-2-oxobutanoate hydroxymethyltransferase